MDFNTRGNDRLDLILSTEADMITDVKASGRLGSSDRNILYFNLNVFTATKNNMTLIPGISKEIVEPIYM